jgi:cobalamin biosynthesis protein CobT
MQFDADPRDYALFSRPILPQRRNPAVLLLVDRSGSMTANRLIDRALEGTVLLIEVCTRIGVPAAVWSFATGIEEELGWDDSLDSAARRRIGSLPGRCDGTTDMATALAATGQAFADRHGDPKLLFVIGDGAPDDRDTTLAAANQLEREGLITIGLGLGPGTAPLAAYFQRSVVEITPETLVDRLAGLLGESLLAST